MYSHCGSGLSNFSVSKSFCPSSLCPSQQIQMNKCTAHIRALMSGKLTKKKRIGEIRWKERVLFKQIPCDSVTGATTHPERVGVRKWRGKNLPLDSPNLPSLAAGVNKRGMGSTILIAKDVEEWKRIYNSKFPEQIGVERGCRSKFPG